VSEFTGERVIPGEVNPDLWAEHISRYAFAARFAAGKRVLDIGCGTGYGTAELAKHAATTIGIDIAPDALDYARSHYAGVHFDQAPAHKLPFPDQSFDLITAFEVIEHLTDWCTLAGEARRVLRHDGLFLVSTPNKRYYTESRVKDGPNPFHTHEFEFDEFRAALAEYFPQVTMFLQNWQESITFVSPLTTRQNIDARIESTSGSPNDAHFFLALCGLTEHPENSSFLYAPSASNLLRDREHHIHALNGELKEARSERDAITAQHAAQKQQLEDSNRWARQLDADWKATLERVAELQDELKNAQARAAEVADAYARKVADVEEENRQKTAWAIETERRFSADLAAKCNELAETVQLLDRAEATVVERTQWAQATQTQLNRIEAQLQTIRESRWYKIGRTIGLGPQLTPDPKAGQKTDG
jgi:ubiquinone/menaquinone biosynthesis C-methylase UbiE